MSAAGMPMASSFDIVVGNVNDAPTLVSPLSNQVATEDTAFTVTIAPDVFTDIDTGDSGITAPWTDSPVTTASVVEGRVVANTREDLVAEFAITEPAA